MRKTTAILGLFLSVCSLSMAQDVNIYWGKFNNEDRFSVTTLIGKRAGSLFGLKQTRKGSTILKYGLNDLQIVGEYPLIGKAPKGASGKAISDDYLYNSLLPMKNNFYVTVTKYDRKTKTNSLYIQEIDNGGRLTGSMKTLETLDAKSKFNRGGFEVIMSNDSTKFLLVDEPPYEKYAGEKFTFSVYDQSLSQIKKLQVELPFKDKYFSLNDITFSDDGNIYMMAKIVLDRKEKTKGESDYYYELISVGTQGDGAVTQYEIKLPGKYIDGISFNPDDDKDIICAGLYGNTTGTAKGDISGVFFMRLNKTTKQIDATGLKDLDKDFIAELTSERKANKGKGISNDFKLKDFIRRSDGGSVLLAEYSYDYTVTTTTTDSHGGVTTRTDYHYVRNNIIAININPDGSIKWAADIPKYQHTVNDGGKYIGYALATKNDKMYIVYNENPANMDPANIKAGKKPKVMGNPHGSTAVLVALSEDGQFDKKALFSNKDNKLALQPTSFLKLNDSELIIPAYNGGFYCCFISFSPAKSKLARFDFK
jgi:hypothetical protein